MKSIILLIRNHYLLILFVLCYSGFSIYFAKAVGIPWDESDVYNRGRVLGEYFRGTINYEQYALDIYGLMYDHLYSLMVNTLNIKKTYGGFHFVNLMFALFGYASAYGLVYSRTHKQSDAIWGPILLWLCTRYSAEAAINPKDMPMAAFYLTSLWLIAISTNWKTWVRIMVLGSVIGLTASTRIVGLTLLPILLLLDLGEITRNQWVKRIGSYIVIAGLTLAILYASWPYLANNFPDHVIPILLSTKKYAWDGLVLYGGEQTRATQLPWTYIPTWILITTPLSILALFGYALGRVSALYHDRAYRVLVLTVVINISLYLGIRPVVYDGFRHFLYLLPIISTLAAVGMTQLIKALRYAAIGALIPVLFTIWKLYPYQYIYFNEIVGGLRGAQSQYEADYFGISHKEATLWLSHNLPLDDKVYSIATCGQTISSTHYFSPRMRWVPKIEMADYLVCYTRFGEHLVIPNENIIYTVSRQGVPLAYVKKIQ